MEKTNSETQIKKLNRTVLDQFDNLTSPQEKNRLRSSLNILKHLVNIKENDIELKHALTRIIRGLGSSTSTSRTGFYTILVALLNIKQNITVETIHELVQKHLHKAGSNSRSENADILTGQILANGAIIRSNLYKKTTDKEKIKIMESILNASKERTYQGLLATEFVISLIQKVEEQEFYELLPLLKDEISKPLQNYNLDCLYLLCTIKKKYPNLPHNLTTVIEYPDIFAAENIGKLSSILMIIPRLSSLQHPIYDIISAEIASSEILNEFIEELDGFLDIPNRNKLLVTIKIYTTILENSEDATILTTILTKNFVHQMLNHFKTLKGKDQDVEFKQRINNFFEKLVQKLKNEHVKSKTKIGVLKKLLFSPGTFIFEKITHSKVVQNITWSLDAEGVKKLGSVYRGVIEGTEIVESQYGHGDYWLNNDKLYAAHLLIKLLNHSAMKEENVWKTEQLIFIMELGLLKENEIRIGTELAASLKVAFFGALDLKLSKLEELHVILSHLVLHLHSKLTPDNLENILRTAISVEEYAIWEKTIAIITKIEKKKKKGGLKSVFLTLFLHLALLLFNDAKLASDSLNELFVCYEKTRKSRTDSETINETITEDTITEDIMWIEVVTDLFLNFLSQNSHLLRNIVNLVFPYLCEYMTPSTIQQLVSVLDPDNENPLSKGNTLNDQEDSDESEDESEKEDESDESNNEEDDDDDEMGDDTATDKLRMALHKVLSSNGYQTDEESVDIDQMSETEGEKLDKALADAFKQFRPNHGKRKKQNEDQRTLTHFRVRVLDLIEIYLDSSPSMILTLEIMLPLLKTVEFCVRDEHQSPLLHRLKSCLKKLSNLKKFSDMDGVDDTVLCELLKSLLEKGTKNTWIVQDMRDQIADCSMYVIKCSNTLFDTETTPKKIRKRLKKSIVELISAELDTYFNKRECITPFLVFKKLFQISWDGNLSLVPLVLNYIFNENVKIFKKAQALELVLLFYTNQRYLSSNSDNIKETLDEHHREFFNNVLTMFKSFCDIAEKKNPSEKFLVNMFKLLTVMKTCTLNIDCINWPEIAEVIREHRSTVSLSRDAKSAFNKLCDRLNVSNIVKMKQISNFLKPSENDNVKEPKERKKPKKTKNKEKLKLKKETKELRLQSLSEGFKDLDFAVTNDVSMEAEEGDTDQEYNGIKRRNDSESSLDIKGEGSPNKKLKKKRNNSETVEEEKILNGVDERVKSKKKKHKT